ncbi:sigma-70 family RNA polymerase sigma factor [Variovorax sp. EBFNA2]|uniref:RNA polymerase sigma factor n=1 Tax=Variovorax sp. EBFNA2 TaxID=3342097 RepID=UPI0029C056C3|nr:sigma-70 family RNA polymerase sigma factor [Variovorax boronicumulans]WPG38860.1 sigma-70 family RNA polymerase sigma factor [Variovorax boronicumulans]
MDMSIQLCLASSEEGDAGQGVALLRDCLVANYQRLHRRLLHRLGCADQASDCLHDAWLRLGDGAVPDAVDSPEAYVFRVACNVAVDRLRADRPWQYSGDAAVELESFADPSPGPEPIAEARSGLLAVERAMRGLPHRHQAIFMGLRIHELTRDEVAARHGLSLRRVDTTLRQALAHCAQSLR